VNTADKFYVKSLDVFSKEPEVQVIAKAFEVLKKSDPRWNTDQINLEYLGAGKGEQKIFAEVFKQQVGKILERKFSETLPRDLCPYFNRAAIDGYAKKDGNETIYVEEYKVTSPEGDELIFAMAHDTLGRTYIDNIYDPRVGMDSYGTLRKKCNMGHLVYKPDDYKEQTFGIPEKYIKDTGSAHYYDISALWLLSEPVRKYRESLERRSRLKKAA
jgi:hypothetical protein